MSPEAKYGLASHHLLSNVWLPEAEDSLPVLAPLLETLAGEGSAVSRTAGLEESRLKLLLAEQKTEVVAGQLGLRARQ